MRYGEEILAATNDSARINFRTHGIIDISGSDALDLLHRLSTNDLRNLGVGECRSTVLTTDKGRIVDYIYLLNVRGRLLMCSSPGHEQSVVDWIAKYTIMEDVQLEIVTSTMHQLSTVGPNSLSYVNSALNISLMPWSCSECVLPDGKEALAFCTKEFGTTSIHIIAQDGGQIMIDQPASMAVMSVESYETFRIMQGIPIASHELREEFNPFETGLAAAISFTKGCYIGQEVIARLDTYQKVQRRLVGLMMPSTPEMSSMLPLFYSGNEVGWLTSVAPIDFNGRRFGLGVVRKEVSVGESVTYEERGKVSSITVADVPILTTTENL